MQASGHSAQRFARCVRSGTDAGGSKQKRVFCFVKNSQSKMYKDVYF